VILLIKGKDMVQGMRLLLVACGLAASATVAQAQQVTLRLSHFTPATSNTHVKMLQPWADKVERESGGRIKIQIFPSLQLGGTVAQMFDQVRDGVVDIAWIYPSASANRFPCVEVFDAPFIGRKAGPTSEALWEYATKNCMNEFRGVRPIAFHAFATASVHSREPIRKLEDFRGKKIRAPSAMANKMVSGYGATPVAMPFTQVAEAISKGVVDGLTLGMESVPTLKIDEMVKFHTLVPDDSPGLYNAALMLAMNPQVYDRLPDDLKKVIDNNSGIETSKVLGAVWDDLDIEARQQVRAKGNDVATLSAEEAKRWMDASQPVIQEWVQTMKSRGRDGEALLKEAKDLIAQKSR
jgi:TRAP-type transport system periplasmic protein